MTAADIVRNALNDYHGRRVAALAALDRLVAERDAALERERNTFDRLEDVLARADRYEKALELLAVERSVKTEEATLLAMEVAQIARAALAEEDTPREVCPDCGLDLEPGEKHGYHPDAGCVAGEDT